MDEAHAKRSQSQFFGRVAPGKQLSKEEIKELMSKNTPKKRLQQIEEEDAGGIQEESKEKQE